jgi:putative exosortase-associated protein (TIGR04073 family)
MKKSLSILFCGVFLLASIPAQAAYPTSPIDDSRDDYGHAAGRKLGRGLANTGLGWMEIFKGMSDVGAENGFWAGATWGPLYGTVNAVRRTGAGLYETATFPFEGPNRFEPLIEPEFVLNETR